MHATAPATALDILFIIARKVAGVKPAQRPTQPFPARFATESNSPAASGSDTNYRNIHQDGRILRLSALPKFDTPPKVWTGMIGPSWIACGSARTGVDGYLQL